MGWGLFGKEGVSLGNRFGGGRKVLLLKASEQGNIGEVARLLKSGADVNALNKDGVTSLWLASQNGHVEVVRELLTYRPDTNKANKHGFTPLHLATGRGYKEIVELLIEAGANVNARNFSKETPIFEPIKRGFNEIVDLLIKAGADVKINDKSGYTPLHFASENGNVTLARLLINGGADMNARSVPETSEDVSKLRTGRTPLHAASDKTLYSKSGNTPKDIGRLGVVQLLCDEGANPNVADSYGRTPMYGATEAAQAILRSCVKLQNPQNPSTVPTVPTIVTGDPELEETDPVVGGRRKSRRRRNRSKKTRSRKS